MWLAYNTAQSPDLIQLDHLWEGLERQIRKHDISSKNDLINALQEEWVNTSKEVTTKLVHSMPRRLEDVVKQKGLLTKY